MFYVVNWLKGQEVVATTKFEHLLEAKAYAKDRLHVYRVRRGVTAAVVADVEGVTYFRLGDQA